MIQLSVLPDHKCRPVTDYHRIVFRAFQGIGGSGLYSMTMVIAFNAVPPQKIGLVAGMLGITLTIGGVAGPLLSGAICNGGGDSWRWIFFLNLPTGGIALALFIIAWPREKGVKRMTKTAFASIDVVGAICLLTGSILLVFVLQEAGTYVYAWDSAIVIAMLVVVVVAFVGFFSWQLFLGAHPDWPVKMTFPVKLVAQHRILAATVM